MGRYFETNSVQVYLNGMLQIKPLTKLGFECVTLSNMRVQEQIRLFKEAQIVVGPHGGGLTNIVFCRPGTQIIELFDDSYIDPFETLSRTVNLDYSRFLNREPESPRGWFGKKDFRIDLRFLDLFG